MLVPPVRHRIPAVVAVLMLLLPLAAQAAPSGADPVVDTVDRVERAVDALDEPGAIPGELIVTARDAGALQRFQQTGWQAIASLPVQRARTLADRVALIDVDPTSAPAALRALLADPSVDAVEPNVRRHYLTVPDDTSYGLQWAHQQTNAEAAWDVYTGQGATAPLIAILDSGVDATHPDLEPVVVQSLRAANGQIISGTPDNDPCDIGHGTAVAGSAAAAGDNGFGIAGVLWEARIIDIALTSPENNCPGGPADADTIRAMSHVAGLAEPPHALNLSLGAPTGSCTSAYQAAVDQARAAGIVVVAAAGNREQSNPGMPSIPASCDGVISVAATTADDLRASYSQVNPQVDIAAPGGDLDQPVCPTNFSALVAEYVITTARNASNNPFGPPCPSYADPNGHDLQGISGTSFSSPYITAAVGLLRQLAADNGSPLSVDQVEAVIEGTARDLGEPGRDCEFGHGVIDLGAAVAAVQSGAIPPLQPDPPLGTGSCDGSPAPEPEELPAGVNRIASSSATTDPISQAVAVSQAVLPDGLTRYAVLARVDEFADALAGSAVGLGVGPLLYTSSSGPLDARTEDELRRILDFSGTAPPVVFIMGGTAAVPAQVDDRLQQLGIEPIRLAGDGREGTAVAASQAVEQLKADAPFETRDYAFVASGRAFADAVTAGQMAAYYGIPVLVTNPEAPLHPATRAELERLAPEQVYVVGGTAAISEPVVDEIRSLGAPVARLAGPTRVDTGIAVFDAYVTELQQDGALDGARTVAVNVRNNFNDVLSATLLGGRGNVFMPMEEDAGESVITTTVESAYCRFGTDLLVIGGQDRVSTDSAVRAHEILQGDSC